MLIVEPGRRPSFDPDLVARTLELTTTETQVAVWLAEGKSVRDIGLSPRVLMKLAPSREDAPGSPFGRPERLLNCSARTCICS